MIPSGGIPVGGCNSYKGKLNKWWADARKLVDAALLYAEDDSVDGPEYLYTFFALDPPPADAQERATVRARLRLVKEFIDGDTQLPTGKPWLFCSSRWLKRMDWDDVAYDKETGDKFTGDDAKKVRDVIDEPTPPPDEANEPKEFPYWSSDLKEYLIDEADDYCTKKVDGVIQHFGATHEGPEEKWKTVTICVSNLRWNAKNDHLALGIVRTEGKSIVEYRAQSMTLFHELFHVVLGNANTEEHEKSYDLPYIANPRREEGEDPGDEDQDIISTQEALYNPESYTLYALASLLGQNNKDYTYLTRVERRLANVERLFHQLLPDVDINEALASRGVEVPADASQPNSSVSLPINPSSPDTPVQASGAISDAVPAESDGFDWQEDVDELTDGMASLSVEPRGAGYLGPTAGVFFLRSLLLWTGHSRPFMGSSPELPRPYAGVESSSQLSNSVTSRQVIEQLVNGYFEVYHRSYPFVHEPTFRAQLHEVIQRPNQRSWQMLLYTIMALGAWCLNNDNSELDDELYHLALSFGDAECLFASADLTFVQALILFSNLSQKRNKPNTGSNFLGLATRMALSLGLHRELPEWNISLLQREMRRRVWWGLYMFDSGASTTFGRPILLPGEEAMDVRPVLNIDDEDLTSGTKVPPEEVNRPTLYSGMKYQSDLHVKSNYISNRLLSSSCVAPEDALSMDATLDKWSSTLPEYLSLDHHVPSAEPAFYFNKSRLWWRFWNLKIIIFRQLFLKRAIGKGDPSVTVPDNEVDEKCMSIAIRAASATIESIDQYTKERQRTRLVTWYSIYFTFHASLVIVLAILSNSESPDMPKWQEDVNTVRHIFRGVFADNELATRCANIIDVILPNPLLTTSDWANVQLDPMLMDFSTWPASSADEFASVLGWPDWANFTQ
ncbi:GAL4-transcription factor [Fusarium tjaetaba]|uniref:GAL4-transcription factor n=1 Tax=Fusarium tjaetaba TaxID=1567544 RepID=A0A8H5S5L0_9HYPO|nr:GAL4-transcription factor [Fusarium tjaetaba]KAF5645822.1 GAL4-transcription factor [Fusarium tjaetaba]